MVTNLKRPLIISLSIIFGSGILAAFGLYILAGNIATTASKIVTDRSLIDKQTGALSVIAALKSQVPQAMGYEAAMEKLLPTQDGLIAFSQWVGTFASQNQVSANVSFSGGAITPPSVGTSGQITPGTASFSLSASGSLDNIVAFLNEIESQAPGFLLQIQSFDLTNENGTYQWTGQGIVFFQK